MDAKADLLEALTKLVSDIDDLAQKSEGVAGLHLNGEIAPWQDLLAGGRYEGWLESVEDARNLIAELAKNGGGK